MTESWLHHVCFITASLHIKDTWSPDSDSPSFARMSPDQWLCMIAEVLMRATGCGASAGRLSGWRGTTSPPAISWWVCVALWLVQFTSYIFIPLWRKSLKRFHWTAWALGLTKCHTKISEHVNYLLIASHFKVSHILFNILDHFT